jgi:hypothetical protein
MRLRLVALVSLGLLAGCASPTPSSSPSAPASPSPVSSSSASSSSASSSETISGTLSAGVEPHCLILRDATGSHSIYFHDESLRPQAPAGAHVTLVGHPEPGMMTTCQQGEPFIVTEVRHN